jgi:hypothetical protein
MSNDEFKKDLEEIITSADYHSDEISETDIEKAEAEEEFGVRPSQK